MVSFILSFTLFSLYFYFVARHSCFVVLFFFSCSANVQTKFQMFYFMLFNQVKLHLLFTVYGFQNNLAPTSSSVLTTSGANVHANVGGMTARSLTQFH